jgi:hypothetical protein
MNDKKIDSQADASVVSAPLSIDEKDAIAALQTAVASLTRAQALCEQAQYGSQVLGPLNDAKNEAQYALYTVLGHT